MKAGHNPLDVCRAVLCCVGCPNPPSPSYPKKGDASVVRLRAALLAARARPAFVRTMPPDDVIVAAQFSMAGGTIPSA